MSTFTIKAAPGTDIWRKPPTTNVFNAPTFAPAGTKTTGPLSTFRSVTVAFAFSPTELYDQGGVVLSVRPPGSTKNGSEPPQKWVKSGVELLNGTPVLGTVACDAWADWSLSPVLDKSIFLPPGNGNSSKGFTTILLQKEGDENGTSLWVYQLAESGEKLPLREICWVFDKGIQAWEVEVAAYAARPKGSNEELEVEFQSLNVQWSE